MRFWTGIADLTYGRLIGLPTLTPLQIFAGRNNRAHISMSSGRVDVAMSKLLKV